MPQPTKQQWQDYLDLFHGYLGDVNLFIQNGATGEVPDYTQPPEFEGFGWSTKDNDIIAWQGYYGLANDYQDWMVGYVEQYVDNGENPRPNRPPKPPQLS